MRTGTRLQWITCSAHSLHACATGSDIHRLHFACKSLDIAKRKRATCEEICDSDWNEKIDALGRQSKANMHLDHALPQLHRAQKEARSVRHIITSVCCQRCCCRRRTVVGARDGVHGTPREVHVHLHGVLLRLRRVLARDAEPNAPAHCQSMHRPQTRQS